MIQVDVDKEGKEIELKPASLDGDDGGYMDNRAQTESEEEDNEDNQQNNFTDVNLKQSMGGMKVQMVGQQNDNPDEDDELFSVLSWK